MQSLFFWSWRVISILMIMLLLWWNILDRFSSPVFHLTWAIVAVIGIINSKPLTTGAKHQAANSIPVQSFLVGLLLGVNLGAVQWVPIDGELLADLLLGLSPMFLYHDLFRWLRETIIKRKDHEV